MCEIRKEYIDRALRSVQESYRNGTLFDDNYVIPSDGVHVYRVNDGGVNYEVKITDQQIMEAGMKAWDKVMGKNRWQVAKSQLQRPLQAKRGQRATSSANL